MLKQQAGEPPWGLLPSSFLLADDSCPSPRCPPTHRASGGGAASAWSICTQPVLAALHLGCSQDGHRGARGSQAWRPRHLDDSRAGKSTELGVRGPSTSWPPSASNSSKMGVMVPLLPKTRTSPPSLGFVLPFS
jgi:hypothetical protein